MYIRVLLPIVFIVLECSLCIKNVAGYFIHIDAHAEECFFDRVTSGTKMSLMFEVAEGGFLDIDVKVRYDAIVNVWSSGVMVGVSGRDSYVFSNAGHMLQLTESPVPAVKSVHGPTKHRTGHKF